MNKTVALVAVKGGVGKTTCAINLARRLHDKYSARVGLIDADFDNSNFAQFTNTNAELKIVDSKEFQLFDWRGVQVFSMSLIAGRERSVSMTGDRYAQMIHDCLAQSNWHSDIFVVDLPSGSSDVFRSVMQLFGDTVIGNIVVTQPSMIDALCRVLNLHKYFRIPVLGIIENMSYFEVKRGKTVTKYYPFGKGRTKEIAEKYGVSVIGEIPLSSTIAEKIIKGEAILDEKYMGVIDKACDIVLEAQPVKTGIFEKIKHKLGKGIQGTIEAALVKLVLLVNSDFDMAGIRRETGFTEKKVWRLLITDESMTDEMCHIDLRMDDSGLKAVKKAKNIDFEVVVDFRTLARIIMRKRKIEGGYEDFSAWDAWLNGDMKAYGLGYSAKAIHAIREIFMNEHIMSKLGDKYGKILGRFL